MLEAFNDLLSYQLGVLDAGSDCRSLQVISREPEIGEPAQFVRKGGQALGMSQIVLWYRACIGSDM